MTFNALVKNQYKENCGIVKPTSILSTKELAKLHHCKHPFLRNDTTKD